MAVIEISKLTKHFGKIHAVDGLCLKIDEGEVFGLLGPNGAGKTTTIKMLATLLAPTSGRATVNGFDIAKSPSKVRQSIGIVFQEPSSDELLSGYENLKLHSMIYGLPGGLVEKRIDDALALVELSDRRNDLVKTYSGGMRRRLEIARGLLHQPKVLFLDEPTLGLDPRGRKTMWGYVKRLVAELNMTILLTTHYMEEADELAGRICVIDNGKAVAVDSPGALKAKVGGDLVTITSSPLPDLKSLTKLKFVRGAEMTDGRLLITVSDAAANLQELLAKIGKVECVEVRSPTLNDVFIKFTGRELEQAEGGWFDKIVQQSVNKQ
ncbi:ATP-binding cassette domain-containing protein [Candidatus Micrarchaeota archaeon]|nr:ATP-binding cassette domain-containing protein [Candidatus Micrarchaeota archaeon]